MKILIVEDELLAARRLEKIVKKLRPNSEIVAITSSIADTLSWLSENSSPDLALMDIELTDGQSFSIFESVTISFPVIFTTAYDEYTLRAFKTSSIDYLLKPIDEEDLLKSIEKFENMRSIFSKPENITERMLELLEQFKHTTSENNYRDRFLIKAGQRYVTIESSDIICFRAFEKVVYLHHSDGREYIIDYSLDELENLLFPKNFFRANRQFIIASKFIKNMYAGFNGKLVVIPDLKEKHEIFISRERVRSFKLWAGA